MQTSDPVPFTFNKPTAKTKCGIVLQGAPAPVVTINSLNTCRPAAFLAKAAGLQVGDTVISINGENVKSATHGATLLKAAVGEVKILVTRQVPMMRHPEQAAAPAAAAPRRPEQLRTPPPRTPVSAAQVDVRVDRSAGGSAASPPRVLTVAGGGHAAANGEYDLSANTTSFGRPVWIKRGDPQYKIQWAPGPGWLIDFVPGAAPYRVMQDATLPLHATWVLHQPAPTVGWYPAPTVTAGERQRPVPVVDGDYAPVGGGAGQTQHSVCGGQTPPAVPPSGRQV